MKKIVVLFMAIITLTACGDKKESDASSDLESDKIQIVTTSFPQYDWVRQILGDEIDQVELTLLTGKGVDLHNYQPTASDIIKIETCDMFIYIGSESDEWVEDVLENANNSDGIVVNLMETMGTSVREEEIIEGMESEEELEEEPEYDEHIWLSLRNAKELSELIIDKLVQLEPEKKEAYEENGKAYITELENLDKQYVSVVEKATFNTLIFGDRFPFRYLVDDYNLNYYAAFAGCSAETEASFETVLFLAEKLDEYEIKNVLVIETSDKEIAKTVVENTKSRDQDILVLDSMQAVSLEEKDVTYISVMEDNLEVLEKVLN